MEPSVRVVATIAAGVLGLLAWNLAARLFIDHTVNSPSAKAEGEYFKMEREAQAKYAGPGTSTAAAMSRYANEKAASVVGAAGSREERAYAAAQVFIGFYLVNTRARVEYCQQQRVDIGNFATAFADLHHLQYERTEQLLRTHGVTLDDTWSTLRSGLMRAVDTDMRAIDMSATKACEEIKHYPSTYAGKLNFADRQPSIQRALMGP